MKTDLKALLWGTVIGVGLVVAIVVQAFDFPHFRVPLTSRQVDGSLYTAFLFALLIASYKKLWKAPGFWALLVGSLGVHITFYWLVVAKIAEEVRGLQMDVLYGALGGMEFVVFALIVALLYHRGPDTRSLT
jgi:hypothetical protein